MAEGKVFTKELIITALASASGLLSVGWNSGCINSPQKHIIKFMSDVYFHRSGTALPHHVITLLWSITVSIFPFGGAIGGYSAGPVSRRFGIRNGLLLTNLLGILAASFMAISKLVSSPELLIIGRLMIGIECGLYSGLSPMYLSEVSPKKIRGQIGSLTAISGSVGLMFAEIFSTPILLGTENLWPLLMVLAAIPSVTQFVLLQFCFESPRYLLINRNNESQAKFVLSKLREKTNVDDEINEIKQEAEHLINEKKVSIWELFTNNIYRLPLAVAIIAHISMRFSGINGIMYYSTALFEQANIGKNSSYATIGVGFISILATILSGYLMDRAGRRILHLTGLLGTFACCVLITITFICAHLVDWLKYFSITFVFAFVVFVGLGPGSVPWVIVPEIFAQGARPAAISVAMVTNWLSNFTVGLIFPLLTDNIPHYAFVPFAIMTLFAILFLYKYLPETKKRTFEEITMSFRSHMRQNTKQLQSNSNHYEILDIC